MIETAVELLVLAGAAASVARRLVSRGGRRLLRREPRLLAAVAAAAVAFAALAGWAATSSPAALRALSAAVAAGWLALAWRARSAYGRRRALPPGSLALADSLAALVDHDFLHARFARLGPVFKMAQFHRPVVCVLGLVRGRELLRRHAGALAPPPLPLSSEIPRGFLRYMTPDDHERYSRLLRAAFTERTLSAQRAAVADDARALLAEHARLDAAAGEGDGGRRPQVDRFLLPALNRIFFGTLLSAADLAVVEQCGRDATFATATGRPTARARAALARFVALLAERHASHDAAGEESVWAELLRHEPASARDPTVLGNLFLLLEASRDSIGGLLLWTVQRLGEHPQWAARLRAELAERSAAELEWDASGGTGAGSDLAARIVLESLRLAQSEYLYRRTLAAIEVDGFVVPRGWLVRICVAESHRLDPPFVAADRFDPDRHLHRRFGPDELSPFGLDRHACLGARLTLFLARLFVEELVVGYDLALVAGGPPERGPRHWLHWAPSARLRVALTPRPGARATGAASRASRSVQAVRG